MDEFTRGEKDMRVETLRHYYLKGRITEGQFYRERLKIIGRVCLQTKEHTLIRLGRLKMIEYPTACGSTIWAIIAAIGHNKVLYEGEIPKRLITQEPLPKQIPY